MSTTTSLAFLGAGRMATALIKGFLQSGLVASENIRVSSKGGASAQVLAEVYGIQACSTNEEAIACSSVVFLCTKPAQALEVLAAHRALLENKLVVSVAAGLSSETLFMATGGRARIVRTMPNTAVRLRKGCTTITPHHSATPEDLLLVKKFFSAVGMVYDVEEDQKNAATAVSGSGPAFALLFLEAMMQGGVEHGLDPQIARGLAAQALLAAASLILETEETPAALRSEIASPRGTTEAGLNVLEAEKFPKTVIKSIEAAVRRAEEFAQTFSTPACAARCDESV